MTSYMAVILCGTTLELQCDVPMAVISLVAYLLQRGIQDSHQQLPTIHLATVACGSRVKEGLVMLKSAAILTAMASQSAVVLHVFSEAHNHQSFSAMCSSWPPKIRSRVALRLYTDALPPVQGWANPFFRVCSNLRLFFHILLPDVDAVLYLDSDILVLSSLDDLWSVFPRLSPSQLMAFAPESEDPAGGWYHRTGIKTPFVAPAGMNSGVILMNLTRLRQSNWTESLVQYSQAYKGKLELGDQDILNVYFHLHPDEFYWLDCSFNYRKDHCQNPKSNATRCTSSEVGGAYILHGNDFGFQRVKGFKAIHDAFSAINLEDDPSVLLDKVTQKLKGQTDPCGKLAPHFLQHLVRVLGERRHLQHIHP